MPVVLKEKVKRYIKENYGNVSINDIATRFGISKTSVEEYIIDELPKEMEVNIQKKTDQELVSPNREIYNPINKTLIVLILIAVATLIVALTVSQLSNNDVWQHLKNGQMILRTHKFQYVEPYSCNAAGKPWINEAWFSGVIFYLCYLLNGPNAIIYLKTIIILFMTTLVLFNCYKLDTKFLLFAPLTVFMIFNVGVRFLARTEMFSYAFIAAFFLILFQYKYNKKSLSILFVLPILQVFWSNMHGSFIVGVFILIIFTLCEHARLLLNRYITYRQDNLLTWPRLKPLYIISGVVFLACLMNPYGFRLLEQPFHVVMRNQEYIKTIYEWQSPFQSHTFMSSYAFKYYLIWMAIFFLSFIFDIRNIDLSNVALSGFFFVMAFKMHRNITIFTIATCPIICLNLQHVLNELMHYPEKRSGRLVELSIEFFTVGFLLFIFKHFLSFLSVFDPKMLEFIELVGNITFKTLRDIGVALIFIGILVFVIRSVIRERFVDEHVKRIQPLLAILTGVLVLGMLLFLILLSFANGYIYRKGSSKPFGVGVASNMPIKSTEYILANGIKGCCFNSYTYGTYLIFHCFPDTRVTMDSRAEHVYGEEFYRMHQAALFDTKILESILKGLNIEYILLKFDSGDLIKLSNYLKDTGEWALVYFDESCFLYLKRLPEYEKLIERDEYKYIHPLITPRQSHVPRSEIDNYIIEAKRCLKYNPDYFFPHILLLNLCSVTGDWHGVIEHGKYLIEKEHRNYAQFMLIGEAYKNLNDRENAERMFKEALKLKPNSIESMNALKNLREPNNI